MFRYPYYWEEGGGQKGYQNILIFCVFIILCIFQNFIFSNFTDSAKHHLKTFIPIQAETFLQQNFIQTEVGRNKSNNACLFSALRSDITDDNE